MSLNFNYKNVADQSLISNPHDPDEYHPVFYTLVWATMSCGFNKITKDNAEKVHQRIKALETVYGPQMHVRDGSGEESRKVYITLSDIEAYIGMTTNASTMTDAQFSKKIFEWIKDSRRLCRNPHGDDDKEITAISMFAKK